MSFQAYPDNIEDKTGVTPRQFIELARERGSDDPTVKAGAIVARLKEDYGLGHGYAMALVRHQEGPEDRRQACGMHRVAPRRVRHPVVGGKADRPNS